MPLEFVIRNVSQKTLVVQHSLYPPETPPTVIDADGKQLGIDKIHLFGSNRRYRNTLQPGEAAVYPHLGLGLGKNPNPGTFLNPFLNDAVPGRYRLSQQAHLTIREEGQDAGASFRGVSGEVAFEIAVAAAPDVVTTSATRIIGRITDPAGNPLSANWERRMEIPAVGATRRHSRYVFQFIPVLRPDEHDRPVRAPEANVSSSVMLGEADSPGWVCTQIRANCSTL